MKTMTTHRMKSYFGMVTALALGLAFATLGAVPKAAAQPAGGNTLQSISVQPLPGQQIQVRLQLSGPAPEPLSFTIDRPARIALDLPGTVIGLESRRVDVKSGGLDTILAAESNGRTRLVLNLDSLMPYSTRVDGNAILVTLGGAQQAASAAPAPAATSAASNSSSAAPMASGGRATIRDIDFRRGADGSGRVIVSLSDPRTPVNLRQQGTQILVDFGGAELPKNLMRRYDVLDFATPVQTIDAMKSNEGARLVIGAVGAYEQLAYQSDNQYTIEIKPISPKVLAAEEKKEYKGERLTLNFQDIEVRAVLQLLADTSGENIVVSDSVTGNVTLRLQNVPWDQALDIVLKTKGLDKRRHDNVIIVAPTEELASREKAELAARKDVQQLAPLRTEFVQVNYAKASELAALLKSGDASLLSERGKVTIDERTNTLLIQDTADKLQEIRNLVTTLDIPVRQVLIEARIVVVNDDFTRSLGARTGFTQVDDKGSDGLISVSGSAAASNSIVDSAIENLQTNGTPFPVAIPTGDGNFTDRYNVNLPANNAAGRIAMALLDSNYLIDLELSAAQAEGRGEIISSPRVITANQKEAIIEQGVEIPYQEAASSGATAIQFKKAVLSLKVTPQITPDSRIIMDLTISKDSVGAVLVSSGGANVPSIDTREIVTQVRVNDGETVVLGGIMETERRDSETKVPWLGDVPVLGYLFKTKTKVDNKDELLIFVTPRILREGANIR